MQMNNFSVKTEYYKGKREQRKKAMKVVGIVLLISGIIAALSFLFLHFFEEKPYGLEEVLWAICVSIVVLFSSVLLFFLLEEAVSCIKEEKKKKTLPLSPLELEKQNIVSSEDYADWLNDYLSGCYKKKLTPLQLKMLAESYNVYYHPELDVFDCKDKIMYYTEIGEEISSAEYI